MIIVGVINDYGCNQKDDKSTNKEYRSKVSKAIEQTHGGVINRSKDSTRKWYQLYINRYVLKVTSSFKKDI